MKANIEKYDALIDGTSPALERAKERIQNRETMKYYYLYLPTANLFAHSELQDVRDDYFFIGHFSDEDKANRMVAIKANQYCCRNDYAFELIYNSMHKENRDKYHYATDYKQLLAEQILLRKQLQEQFRNEKK